MAFLPKSTGARVLAFSVLTATFAFGALALLAERNPAGAIVAAGFAATFGYLAFNPHLR